MKRRLLSAGLTLVVSASVALASPAPAHAAEYVTARALLGSVTSAVENNVGYDRALFQDWIDANKDCQNTRQEVLVTESKVALTYTTSSGCTVQTGQWLSRWDGATWTLPADVDIDHHVPMAEAWGSGARDWTSGDRARFSNDLYGPALNAITDNLNSSKGARDPAEWLPPKGRCLYSIWWVQVKYRWRMTIDNAERSALQSIFAEACGDKQVKVPVRAR